MSNRELSDRIYQAGFSFRTIWWVSAQWEDRGFHSFLEDVMGQHSLHDNPFGIRFSEDLDGEGFCDELCQSLKLGFVAEVLMPERRPLRFKNGKCVAWSVYSGINTVEYVYAETIEELVSKAEASTANHYQREFENWKSKNKIPEAGMGEEGAVV